MDCTLFVALLAVFTPLTEPAPTLRDLDRFPGSEIAFANWQFANGHRLWLERCQALEPYRKFEFAARLDEAWPLRRCWDLLDDATDERYCDESRLEALIKLRRLLGPAAYFRGELPPCVPLHRFRTID